MEALIIQETNAFINVNKTKKIKGVFVCRETEQRFLFLLTEGKTNKNDLLGLLNETNAAILLVFSDTKYNCDYFRGPSNIDKLNKVLYSCRKTIIKEALIILETNAFIIFNVSNTQKNTIMILEGLRIPGNRTVFFILAERRPKKIEMINKTFLIRNKRFYYF